MYFLKIKARSHHPSNPFYHFYHNTHDELPTENQEQGGSDIYFAYSSFVNERISTH